MIRLIALFLCLLLIYPGAELTAQQIFDARGAAMGYSNAADTRGLEQAGLNPATLALPHRYNFEFNLLSLSATVHNNSVSKALYDRYFTTGDSLTQSHKDDLLSHIPNNGIGGDVDFRVNTLAFYLPNFSLSLTGLGNGQVQLPKELAEIALNGNSRIGETYDLSNVSGNAWGGLGLLVSGAYPLSVAAYDWLDFAAVGVTAKYLVGVGYAEVIHSEGAFHNVSADNNRIYLDSYIETRVARGGNGIGADLGVVARSHQRWTYSIALLNVLGSIKWKRDPEHIIAHVDAENLAVTSDGIADSLVMSEDSTFAVDPFSSRLPLVLDLGVAYRVNDHLLATAEFEDGYGGDFGGSGNARLAIGAEYTLLPFLPLRSGFSIGGTGGQAFAFGFGLDLSFWFLDVAFVNHGSLAPGISKGISLAATTRLRF